MNFSIPNIPNVISCNVKASFNTVRNGANSSFRSLQNNMRALLRPFGTNEKEKGDINSTPLNISTQKSKGTIDTESQLKGPFDNYPLSSLKGVESNKESLSSRAGNTTGAPNSLHDVFSGKYEKNDVDSYLTEAESGFIISDLKKYEIISDEIEKPTSSEVDFRSAWHEMERTESVVV